MKSTVLTIGIALMLSFGISSAIAQDIHFIPFDAAPLYINPALTGMFDGNLRVSGIYQNQWNNNTTSPFSTYGLSADLPVFTDRHGNYFSTGVQLVRNDIGDEGTVNFSGMASLAYHKLFSIADTSKNCDLGIGLQGSYSQRSVNLANIYFNSPNSPYGTFIPGTGQYQLGLGNDVSYYAINAGITFSQATGARFSYTAGISANNLNQPKDPASRKDYIQVGLESSYTAILGANWDVANRLTLRPAILYQSINSNSSVIGGNEFRYAVGNASRNSFFTSVFAGAWYRTGDHIVVTAGTEFRCFRLCLGYGMLVNSTWNEGMEMQLQYIAHRSKKSSKQSRIVPCTRF